MSCGRPGAIPKLCIFYPAAAPLVRTAHDLTPAGDRVPRHCCPWQITALPGAAGRP